MSKFAKISILLISLFFLVFTSFYELRKIDFFDSENLFDFVWKNDSLSWTTTKDLFYKKWDLLEYNFFLQKDFEWTISINTDKLDKIIKDYDIYLNDEKINKNRLKNLKIDSSKILTFKWKAINNKTINTKDKTISDLIDVVVVDQNEISDKKTTITWSLNNVKLSSLNFNSNINNLLVISWDNLENIQYVNIWWNSFNPNFNDKKIYIWIDKNSFAALDYFVFFQLKNKQILSYPQKISFTYDSNTLNISAISPALIKNDIDRYIVIQWNNLSKVIRVQLSNNIVLKETAFKIINDNVMTIKIPSWLNPWNYFINFMWTKWIFELKNSKFTITN